MALDPWSYAEKTGKEHAHQAALFMWANMACRFGLYAADDPRAYTVKGVAQAYIEPGKDCRLVPQLKWLHAIHNQGHGDAIRGAKARAEGVKAGVYDLFLPVPISKLIIEERRWHGLYLELKVGNNKPSDIQVEFGDDMKAAGYAVGVAWGWLEARKIILDYLGLPS